jgi:phenylacetic acid degradation operon negative regulatory protein
MPEGLIPWCDRLVIFESAPLIFSDWARGQVFPALSAESCAVIARLCSALDGCVLTTPQARVTRVLLVHFWRRLVLRYPTIEAPLDDWPLARAHRALASLYPQLVRMSDGAPECKTRFDCVTK